MFLCHKLRTEKKNASVWSMRVVVDGLAIIQPITAVERLEGKVFLNTGQINRLADPSH